ASHPHADLQRDFLHTVERQADQLRAAGIAAVPALDLAWLAADISRYRLPAKFALLVPGGSAKRPEKRWPVERFAALATDLANRGIAPVVLGVAAERALAAAIPAARDLTGDTSFAEIATLARQAQFAVGNDTGPMQ